MRYIRREYLRSSIFGIEDSLVSTTGLIAGISVGTNDKKIVILGGIIAIAIEAVSMGAGEYLSDDAVKGFAKAKGSSEKPPISGLIMFVSYALAGLIPLLPVLLLSYPDSLITSIVLAMAALFLLGYIKGLILHISPWKGAFKILVVGGIATALGVAVGLIFKI